MRALIREQELLDAIAECQGERNPDARTCRNLAAFYTILDHMQDKEDTSNIDGGYSYALEPKPEIEYQSDSEFYQCVSDMDINDIIALFDEVMETLQIVNPRLYQSVIRKVT